MTTTIDFNSLGTGTVVNNQFSSDGVTISATGGSGQAMIFDTNTPTGGDGDLATHNLGNVLIISEDGDSNDPDDNAGGGTFSIAFDAPSAVQSLTFLDIEETATITLYDVHDIVIGTISVPTTGDNGQVVAAINVPGVARMDVTLCGSGAIDNLVFETAPTEQGPDFIVEGTSEGEVIDGDYVNDPEDDLIDAGDNQTGTDDDSIRAGGGDDTVRAGGGNDTVSGDDGDDFILGDSNNAQDGDDLLMGDDGDDTLCGLNGEDTLDGGAGDDLLEGMQGDDLLLGGSGNDLAYGDSGNDTIYGDSGTQDDGSVREVFQWDLAPNTYAPDFSQDTGNVTVSFSEVNGGASDDVASNTQNVSGIDTGILGAVDATSSLDSETHGRGNSGTYTLGFSDPVANVSFRVNDIDGDGVVRIEAYDANGNPIEVQLDGGSNLTLLDTDGVAGVDTADSNGGYQPDTSEDYSVLVTIPGPVSEIRIFHSQDGAANSGINVTDVYFDVPGAVAGEGAGDDSLYGGTGDDLIFGENGDDLLSGGTGNDTLNGGDGADTITGGDDRDTIVGGTDGDVVDGGTGSTAAGDADDFDTLDLRGIGPFEVINETDDADGNSTSGTILFLNADGTPNGNTMRFAEIEEILGDRVFPNEDPDAVDDSDSTVFETTVSINLLDNDTDADGDTLTVTDISVPASEGALVETAPGVYDFTPADGFEGTATVTYTISDGQGGTDTATHTIAVGADPTPADGIVDGEDFGEVMAPLYDDADGPTDGGGDIIDGPDGDDDSIRGNGGDDTINAGAGDDTVDGGTDNDSVLGGSGDDIVDGEDGDDTVFGGDGNDSVTGGIGADVLDGGDGDDSLTGGSGDDTIDGGIGNDTITGSSGADSITDLDGDNEINSDSPGSFNPDLGVPIGSPDSGFFVTPGDDPNDNKDTITTGDGDDTITAGDDADLIDAGDGDNVIDGGTDADTITSGDGNDSIIGGEGDDLINSGDGDDTINGGIGNPAANFIDEPNDGYFGDPILNNGDDTINAGAGNDVVDGEDDNDLIDGGSGDDTLDGGIDDDTILGGTGDDVIVGGQGADILDGGTGDDAFKVGTFTDPNGSGDYQEGVGDTIIGGEDAGDGDEDTLDLRGSGSLEIVYDDAIDPTGTPGESGTVIFYTDDTQTEVSGTLGFREIENVIPCFTPGAMIATPRGEVPVETLRAGDKVITRDNGIQEIAWAGSRTLNRQELSEGDGMKPILVKAGSLGRNLPERDMLVSPQHRVLVTGEKPQLYFEESEVLVAAKHLVGRTGVSIMDTLRTTYIHFMFEQHEVVLSDGAWTESFQPGDQTMGSMGEATRDEIFALFPELATAQGLTDYAAARRSLKAHEAKLLRN